MELGLEIEKTDAGIRINILEIRYVLILTFLAQICPKMALELDIQKTNVGIRIIIFEIPCVSIFRQDRGL